MCMGKEKNAGCSVCGAFNCYCDAVDIQNLNVGCHTALKSQVKLSYAKILKTNKK